MAIILNDNIKINAGKPSESKYLNTGNTAYASVVAANLALPVPVRHMGLTVLVVSGGTNIEYWYENGVADVNLIQKKYESVIPSGDFVTGATNIGYFSGTTAVQQLLLSAQNSLSNYLCYDGYYNSLYNNYFKGIDGNVHIGTPNDGIPKRGYVKTSINPGEIKSWLWDDSLNGWSLVDGNISNCIGGSPSVAIYYPPVYTATTWITAPAPNGSKISINAVIGNLTSGGTLTIGGPVYATKINNVLDFRTLQTQTPGIIKITSDEAFVYLSGTTGNVLITASNGLTKAGTNVTLGGILTGATIITDSRVTPIGIQYAADYSASFTDRSLIDRGYLNTISSLGGERIYKTICQTSHGFSVGQVVGFSGCTYNKPIATGTYDGEVLGVVSKCFNADCFELTQAGFVSGITVGGGLVINNTYFLSASVAGCLTACEPTTPNYLSKSMFIATSNGSCGCGWVLPYAGYVITSGITQGGALIRNVCNVSVSPYAVTCNDFYIGAQGADIIQLNSNINGQVVVVDDVCGNAGVGCEIQIQGVFFGCSAIAYINTPYGSMTFIYNGGKAKWSSIGFSTAPY
jgi:hypothetical protein